MDDRRKKLLFRAWRRGFQEMDLMMGRFADANLSSMVDADLDAFEALMHQPDQEVYDWLLERAPIPAAHDTPLLARIRAHRP
jgi:antitoxin CptB